MVVRPRRSVLYMPGSNQRAIEKAKTLPADCVVLDLEDSIGPEKKVQAREQIVQALYAGGFGKRELVVRINRLDTEWGQNDLEAVASSCVDAICLPKVENAEEAIAAAKMMDASGAPASMNIWAMIETPKGVLNIDKICSASSRLNVVVMGTTDLAKELRVPHTANRIGLQYALGRCVLSARVHQKDILDGVYLDLESQDGLVAICEQGRDLGFDGKTLIHPSQLAVANKVFAPSEGAVIRARKIIDVWQEVAAQGKGVAVVDGQLVEGMHVDDARRTLAITDAIAEMSDAI